MKKVTIELWLDDNEEVNDLTVGKALGIAIMTDGLKYTSSEGGKAMKKLPKERTRLAKKGEVSISLLYRGYEEETCSGVCLIHSSQVNDTDLYVITGMTHKCGKGDQNKELRKY